MASQVVMPKMSDTMEEGIVVKWLKREGEPVQPGEALAEIETDKAVLELEAQSPGVLRKILVQEDSRVPVGQLIAVIAAAEEEIAPLVGGQASPPATFAPAQTLSATALPSPSDTGMRREVTSSSPQGTPARERIDASPLARRMAEEAGLDIAQIRGTGPGGRVLKRDIEGYLAQRQVPPHLASAKPAPSHPAVAEAGPGADFAQAPVKGVEYQEQELSLMRRTIARRMVQSKTTAPHFYITMTIDMEPAIALRDSLNVLAGEDAKISFTDMVLKAVANALRQFPRLNVSFSDDKIRLHQRVHIGLAVALEDGLITPVIRDCDRKSLGEIAREARELSERARSRRLRPEDYTGGTFSVSNLGMYEVEEFGAIINPPEAAILAVGSIQRQPVVVDDQVTIRHRMKATLSCDHRVVDGATAAQFLKIVKGLLEQPLKLML